MPRSSSLWTRKSIGQQKFSGCRLEDSKTCSYVRREPTSRFKILLDTYLATLAASCSCQICLACVWETKEVASHWSRWEGTQVGMLSFDCPYRYTQLPVEKFDLAVNIDCVQPWTLHTIVTYWTMISKTCCLVYLFSCYLRCTRWPLFYGRIG